MGSPGSLTRCVRACVGSSTAQGPRPTCDDVGRGVAFRLCSRRRHPGRWTISRLNTQPTRTPVNASPPSLRTSAHDSGPMWLARPSSCGSFIHNTSPVLPAHEHRALRRGLSITRRLRRSVRQPAIVSVTRYLAALVATGAATRRDRLRARCRDVAVTRLTRSLASRRTR